MKEITKIINVLQEQINDSINLRQEEIAGANLALNKLKKLLPKANPVENLVIASEQPKGDLANGAVADTLELEKAHNQCHNCLSSWNYRGKQDQGWCYSHRNYIPGCKDYRDS